MRAAILTAINEPIEVHEVDCLPLAYGQVRVRVIAAGICGAQLQEIRGEKGGPLPHLMGHEGCGTVAECGEGVTRVKVGDLVVMHWRKADGVESPFPKYRFKSGQEFTSGLVTTWAEETVCSENRLTPVPETTQHDLCVSLGCSLSTALATVESETRGFGERVLVIGCGGLGQALLGALELVSPSRVCACDIFESKRRSCEIQDVEYVNLSREKLDGKFDLILDTAGAQSATEAALQHLAPSGRIVLIGQSKPGKPICIANARHLFDGEGKSIKATQGGGFRPDLDIPRYLRIANRLPVYRLITHTLPLAEINQAIALVQAGEAGRVMIKMDYANKSLEVAKPARRRKQPA